MVRRLTAKEGCRLQGIRPESIHTWPGDDAMFRLLGNAMSVNVLRELATDLVGKVWADVGDGIWRGVGERAAHCRP